MRDIFCRPIALPYNRILSFHHHCNVFVYEYRLFACTTSPDPINCYTAILGGTSPSCFGYPRTLGNHKTRRLPLGMRV
ncbi:hypothetical protein M3J09_009469 [Ascochyta lentis]